MTFAPWADLDWKYWGIGIHFNLGISPRGIALILGPFTFAVEIIR